MATSVALTEAVIISGPRRGQITHLSDDLLPEVSEEDIRELNKVLDQLDAGLERFAREIRLTVDALRDRENHS